MIYLLQVNYTYGDNAFLPYSVGRLLAYANQFVGVECRLVWSRSFSVNELVDPSIIGISHYVWNAEWNKDFASKVRKHWPNCLIVAGGPQVPNRLDKVTDEYNYFDILVTGEGERAFLDIIKGKRDRFIEGGRISEFDTLRSPYIDGIFNDLLDIDVNWQATQETNRGCPYRCTFCLTEDNSLLTTNGAMSIRDIVESKDDIEVWTEEGFHKVITKISRRYSGDIISIKPQGRPIIKCTPEHKLITKRGIVKANELILNDHLKISANHHNHRFCGTLDIADMTNRKVTIKDDYIMLHNGKGWCNRYIQINDDFLRLAGLFIAEGCVHKYKNRKNTYSTSWTFGNHETDLILETVRLIIDCLGIIPGISKTNTGIQVITGYSLIGIVFSRLFGTKSLNIHIPYDWMNLLDNNQIMALLSGYLDGDGCLDVNSKNTAGRTIASTISQTLSFQIQLLLSKLGIKCGISARYVEGKIQGRKVNTHKQYRMEFPGILHDKNEPHEYCKITEISKSYLDGLVYNIEVDKKHTYSNNGIETKNCDWGSATYSKVRKFDLDIVKDEIKWMSDHQIEMCYNADANFGMLPQDEDIAKALVESKINTGYPKQFRAAYAKKTTPRVFSIGKMLSDEGMCKGVTLSMQSMSEEVQREIKRSNIPINEFGELMDKYRLAHVPTYSEIILGLPGETRESFMQGICKLLELGQHDGLNIYPCMLLKNSEMAESEGIMTVNVPMILNHASIDDDIVERYDLVISTPTMTYKEWLDSFCFAWFVQVLHTLGALRIVSMNSKSNYYEFYTNLYSAAKRFLTPMLSRELSNTATRIHDVIIAKSDSWNVTIDGISWPLEEYSFINIMHEYDSFLNEIRRFLNVPKDIIDKQRESIKKPNEYEDYERQIVWYGRKGGSLYKDGINYPSSNNSVAIPACAY